MMNWEEKLRKNVDLEGLEDLSTKKIGFKFTEKAKSKARERKYFVRILNLIKTIQFD